MSPRDKRLEKAQMRVLFTVPFFAPGVAKLPVEWDGTIKTACTDGKRIRFNPQFFDGCKDQELVTVLCEEVGHCMLGHLWRAPSGVDWKTWNQACDQAVRNMMQEFGEAEKAKRLADPFPFPGGDAFLPNAVFRNMAEEKIYQILSSQKPPPGGGGGGSQGSGKGKGKPQPGQPQPGNGQPDEFAEFEQPKDPSSQQAKAEKNEWDSTLMQACQMAKGRGDLPGGMARFIGELLNPTVPWWELVRQWLREQANDDWNWMKPNKFYDESSFILPSLDSERMGSIVFATDTSGSIDHDMLRHFQSEKQNCLDDLKPSKLVDYCCDTRITSRKEYQPGDTIDNKAPGGGGTSFVPVFDECEKLPAAPKCLVYLTDLDGSFPDRAPDYPVLWVVYGCGDKKAPFGETIKAD